MAKNWINGAIKKPGSLHKQLGVPQGKKIPAAKLDKAADAGGKLGKRANLAKTLEGLGGHKKAPTTAVASDRGDFKIRG